MGQIKIQLLTTGPTLGSSVLWPCSKEPFLAPFIWRAHCEDVLDPELLGNLRLPEPGRACVSSLELYRLWQFVQSRSSRAKSSFCLCLLDFLQPFHFLAFQSSGFWVPSLHNHKLNRLLCGVKKINVLTFYGPHSSFISDNLELCLAFVQWRPIMANFL